MLTISIHIDTDIDIDITLYFAKNSGNRTRFPGLFGFFGSCYPRLEPLPCRLRQKRIVVEIQLVRSGMMSLKSVGTKIKIGGRC